MSYMPRQNNFPNKSEGVLRFYGEPQVIVFYVSLSVSFCCAVALLLLCCKRVIKMDTLSTLLLSALTTTNLALLILFIVASIRRSFVGITESNCNFSNFCVVSSAVWSLCNMSSLFWTLIIGACCSVELVTSFTYSSVNKKLLGFFFTANLGIPVLIIIVALSKGALGWTDTALCDGWCWISTCNATLTVGQQWAWMLLTNKLWEMLCAVFIVNVIFMGFCVRHRKLSTSSNAFPWASVRRSADDRCLEAVISITNSTSVNDALENSQSQQMQPEVTETLNSSRLFLWIPVLLIFSRIGGMVRFFMDSYTMFNPEADRAGLIRANAFFEIYQGMGDVSQATLNLILVLLLRVECRHFFVQQYYSCLKCLRERNICTGQEQEHKPSSEASVQ